MSENTRGLKQILTGRIIEVLEEGDENLAKIHLETSVIQISVNDLTEIYLGDEINIDCNISVNRITPKISTRE